MASIKDIQCFVVGNSCVEFTIYGAPDNINPEKIHLTDAYAMSPAGSGFVCAKYFRALGAKSCLISALGALDNDAQPPKPDSMGSFILNNAKAIDTTYVKKIRGVKTPINLALIRDDADTKTFVHSGQEAIEHIDHMAVLNAINNANKSMYNILHICGLGLLRDLEKRSARKIITAAKEHNFLISADILPLDRRGSTPEVMRDRFKHILGGVHWFFPNIFEALLLTRSEDNVDDIIEDDKKLENIADEIMSDYGIENVCITLGPKGAFLCAKKKDDFKPFRIPARNNDEMRDPTGAGDAFATAFMIAKALGNTPKKCAQIGTIAAWNTTKWTGAVNGMPKFSQLK